MKVSSQRKIPGIRNAAGVGYVICPLEIDRNIYVTTCLQKGTVSIQLENGGIVNNVLIPKHSLNDIVFPKTFNQLGSIVFWVNVPKYNQPIIVGVYNKNEDINDVSENSFIIRRVSKDNIVEILGKDGIVSINADSKNGGKLYINLTGVNSEMKVFINGTLQIETNKDITLRSKTLIKFTVKDKEKESNIYYKVGEGFYYKDEFDNKLLINSDGFIFNDGDLGGLPKVEEVKNSLDGLQNQITTLKNALTSSFSALSGLDASASLNAFNLGTSTMVDINTENIENEKIKQ